MLLEFIRFELAYRLKRPATWIYFLIFFLLSFLAITTDSVRIGGSAGKVFINAPFVVTSFVAILSIFGIFVASAVMGVPLYRDLEHKTATFFFTLPFKRRDYLAGRFLGSFMVLFGIMLSVAAGILIGSVMPWLEADKLGPTVWMGYVNSYLYLMLPNLLLMSGIFFSLVALTRRIVAAYTGSAILFVLYIISGVLAADIENSQLASLLDPFALNTFTEITKYWTVVEKNAMALPLTQDLLVNRLIYGGIGILLLVVTFVRFDVGRFAGFSGKVKKAPAIKTEVSEDQVKLPAVSQYFSFGLAWRQMLHLGKLEFTNIARDMLFLSMLFATLIFLFLDASYADQMYGTTTFPVTYNTMDIAGQTFSLLMYAILIFFSGELVWRERSLNFSGITDSFPVKNWVYYGAKYLALLGITLLLVCSVILAGISVQAFKGYFNFELGLYARELFVHTLPGYLIFASLCFFIHSLFNNKFLSFFIIILVMIGNIVLGVNDFSHPIYRFGDTPSYTYSDMNGYGHFMQGWGWYTVYWAAFALLLAVLANLLWLRGSETTFKNRLRMMGQRFGGTSRALMFGFLALWLGLGAFAFYNTNVLNTYRSGDEGEARAAAYEETYKKYEDVPQPKITEVSIRVDLRPEEIAATVDGTYMLMNKTNRPIDSLHLQLNNSLKLSGLWLDDKALEPALADEEHDYHIYVLDKPMQPGEQRSLRFQQGYAKEGFVAQREQTRIVENGTFFNSSLLPKFGYNKGRELSDNDTRKEYDLPERERMADLDDEAAWENHFLSDDADWIKLEAIISTSPDQIAIAPGYLQREWEEGGRKYYHYQMDTPILDFFSVLSARYEVLRDEWKPENGGEPVAIEIFYHKGHEFNIDRMVAGIKASLDYFTENFGPYQHEQVRILEFPRYSSFAQSFPNTIPYSESIGFIARIDEEDPKDIDYPYYVTAHEVAHQWWGHQVVPAEVQGGAMLSETFSQYSAMMVMKEKFGEDKMNRFLRYELDRYLSGRSGEREKELPLYRVESQPYIYYRKGSVVMYALQDYLGEETVNRALNRLVDSVAFSEAPYPTTRAFLNIMRDEAPDSLHYLIEDMFEKITLFENRAMEASAREVDGKWEVEISMNANKRYAGELGEETETPMNDWVDIGVFTEKEVDGKTEQVPLYMKKHRLTSGEQTITVRVDEKPLKAGIDPYNKLIDRNPGDNTTAVDIL